MEAATPNIGAAPRPSEAPRKGDAAPGGKPRATARHSMDGISRERIAPRAYRQKETDPRGLRGSAGSRKVPDAQKRRATTFVVAHESNFTSSSWTTSSPSSSLASVDHLLQAKHCS